MSDQTPLPGKDELVRLINQSWNQMGALLDSIPAQTMGTPGPEGWSVSDHVAHMGAWERIAVASVRGESEEAAVGLDTWEGEWDTDRFNDLLYRKWAGKSAADCRNYFEQSHAEMMKLIGQMDDANLNADLPNEPGRPSVDKIVGNTYAHYDEHRQWIRQLLATLQTP
jgi:hypothetical protein